MAINILEQTARCGLNDWLDNNPTPMSTLHKMIGINEGTLLKFVHNKCKSSSTTLRKINKFVIDENRKKMRELDAYEESIRIIIEKTEESKWPTL